MKEQIAQQIIISIKSLQKNTVWADFDVPDITVERPTHPSHGDWTTNIAFALAKNLHKAPQQIAEELAKELNDHIEEALAEAVGGYINITLARSFFTDELVRVLREKEDYGKNDILNGKSVMIEYTDPNPFKEFHIGHLMPNVIGESIACMYEAQGATVIRANFYGDVGMHVAKSLWGIRQMGGIDRMTPKELGQAYAKGATAFEKDKQAKEEITALNKKVYLQDESIVDTYKRGRTISLEYFETIYKILGTKFDEYFPESETAPVGKKIVQENIGTVFEKSKGAVIFVGEKYDLHTRVFINAQGLPTYEAKDLGLMLTKFKKYPNLYQSITVTGNEIQEYFKVIIKAMEQMHPEIAKKTSCIAHGMLQLSTGKMSSRTGKIISGEFLINEARTIARAKMSERTNLAQKDVVIDMIAIAGIKFGILKQSTKKNITYDLEEALSFDGDSGPYIQYTHARCHSVITKAHSSGITASAEMPCDDTLEVEHIIAQFGEVVERAGREYAPHYIAQYLIDLARAYNSFYAKVKIIDSEDVQGSAYRIFVTTSVAQVLRNGLHLLGIEAPEKM